jgi:hypothetical protein
MYIYVRIDLPHAISLKAVVYVWQLAFVVEI